MTNSNPQNNSDYEYTPTFDLHDGPQSLDNLADTLRSLRDQYRRTNKFASKVIYKIETPYWDFVGKYMHNLDSYVSKVTDHCAGLTVSHRFDIEDDKDYMQIHLVWKGSW